MKKEVSVPTGIAQLEKLAGGASVLALAVGATACSFAPSSEPVATPAPAAALVEVADADVSEALIGYSQYAEFQVQRFTNKAAVSVEVKAYDSKATGCLSTSALTEGTTYACGTGKTEVKSLTSTAAKKTINVDTATEGIKTVYFGLKDTATPAKFSNVLTGTVVYDKTGPSITATVGSAADASVTLTVTSATDSGSGFAGGLTVAYNVAKNGVYPTFKDTNVLKSCKVTGRVITCTGLKNGAAHKFKVCGLDRAGNQGCSTASNEYVPKAGAPAAPVVVVGSGKALYVNSAAQVWSFTAKAGTDDTIASYAYAYGATLPADSAPTGFNNRAGGTMAAAASLKVAGSDLKGKAATALKPGLIGLAEGVNFLWVKVTGTGGGASAAGKSQPIVVDTKKPSITIDSADLVLGASGQYQLTVQVTRADDCSAPTVDGQAGCSPLKTPVVSYKAGVAAPTDAKKNALSCSSIGGNTFSCTGFFTPGKSDTKLSLFAQVGDEAGNLSVAATRAGATGGSPAIAISTGNASTFEAGELEASYSGANVTVTWPEIDIDAGLVGFTIAYAGPKGAGDTAAKTAPATCAAGAEAAVAEPGETTKTFAIRAADSTAKNFAFRVCPVDLNGNVGAGVACDSGSGEGKCE